MHTFRTKFQQPVIPAFMVRNIKYMLLCSFTSLSLNCLLMCCFLLAGVERQLLSSDGPAGSQCGAKWTEEKQRHQQLQRQPHLDSRTQRAGRLPPSSAWPQSLLRIITSAAWLRSKPYHGRVKSLEYDGLACSKHCVCVAWQQKVFYLGGNKWVICAFSDRIIQMYDSGYRLRLGHIRCSLISSPLSIHLFSTVPLLLEQRFSAGRCPSSPSPKLSAVLSRSQLRVKGPALSCLLSPCAFLLISKLIGAIGWCVPTC